METYKSIISKDPKLKFLLDEFINDNRNDSNIKNVKKNNIENDEDSIKIMFSSIRSCNNNPKMSCQDIIKFLKNYEESKKLFNDITITELDNIILAANHVCQTNPQSL